MKKKLLVCMILLCVVLYSGCSKAKDPPVPSTSPDISSEIIKLANAKNNVIGVNSVHVDYDKDGKQKAMKLYLWALERQDESNDYWLELNVLVNENGINAEKGQTLPLRTIYNPIQNGSMYDIDTFLKRFNMLNFKAIVEGYKVGEPAYFQLLYKEHEMNANVFDPDANTKYVAFDNNSWHEVEQPAEFTPDHYNMTDRDFYVLYPYYQSSDSQEATFSTKDFIVIMQNK